MMKFNPDIHHRRSIRLREYDYSSAGAYFVTICSFQRECLFGEVINGEMRLNDAGNIGQAAWYDLPNHYPYVELDEFVIMPNHFHGVIVIADADIGAGLAIAGSVGAGFKPAPTYNAGTTREAPRFIGNRTCIQNIFRTSHQHIAQQSRLPGVAAKLLRTRYSQRGRPGQHQAIHCKQSSEMGSGREQPGECGKTTCEYIEKTTVGAGFKPARC